MAALIKGTFTKYALTQEEALNGAVLTPLQLQVMQNELEVAAQRLVNFDFDGTDVKVLLDHAYHKAAVHIYQNIIDRSEAAEKLLNQAANAAAQNP